MSVVLYTLFYPENMLWLCHSQRELCGSRPSWPLLLSDLIFPNGAFGPSGSIRAWWVIHRSIWDCKIAESRWRINQANKILRFSAEVDEIARKQASHRNNSERRFRVLRMNGENAPIKSVNANDKLNVVTSYAIWLNDQCENYQCDLSWSRTSRYGIYELVRIMLCDHPQRQENICRGRGTRKKV